MTGLPSPGDALLRFEPLTEGVLLKRYKRFLADVELRSGATVTAHCANTSWPGPGSKPKCQVPMANLAGWASTRPCPTD